MSLKFDANVACHIFSLVLINLTYNISIHAYNIPCPIIRPLSSFLKDYDQNLNPPSFKDGLINLINTHSISLQAYVKYHGRKHNN